MDRASWLAANRAALEERLKWLRGRPSGVLCSEPSGDQLIMVDKFDFQVRMWLLAREASLIQSRFDLRDPLSLISSYTQAAMLALCWPSQPQRLYLVGLGGARLPLVLHHYLPDAVIDCAEIDPVVIRIASRYFGFQADARLQVTCQDGRSYLAGSATPAGYDLIFVDAFSANVDSPFHLATRNFYQLCRARLSAGGAVVVNILHRDSHYADKIKTLQSVFSHIYLWSSLVGNGVVIATDSPLRAGEALVERARELQTYHQFAFPLVSRAEKLVTGPALLEILPELQAAQILVDSEDEG